MISFGGDGRATALAQIVRDDLVYKGTTRDRGVGFPHELQCGGSMHSTECCLAVYLQPPAAVHKDDTGRPPSTMIKCTVKTRLLKKAILWID